MSVWRRVERRSQRPWALPRHGNRRVAAVRSVLRRQADEFTPAPEDLNLTPLSASAVRWGIRWQDVQDDPYSYLPAWFADRYEDLLDCVLTLPERLGGDTLCHSHVRNDNTLSKAMAQQLSSTGAWRDVMVVGGPSTPRRHSRRDGHPCCPCVVCGRRHRRGRGRHSPGGARGEAGRYDRILR
jgi:hypothetical protein